MLFWTNIDKRLRTSTTICRNLWALISKHICYINDVSHFITKTKDYLGLNSATSLKYYWSFCLGGGVLFWHPPEGNRVKTICIKGLNHLTSMLWSHTHAKSIRVKVKEASFNLFSLTLPTIHISCQNPIKIIFYPSKFKKKLGVTASN